MKVNPKASGSFTLDDLLSRLQNVKEEASGQYRADCPAHDSKSGNALRILPEGENGKVVLTCFRQRLPLLKVSDQCDDNKNGCGSGACLPHPALTLGAWGEKAQRTADTSERQSLVLPHRRRLAKVLYRFRLRGESILRLVLWERVGH